MPGVASHPGQLLSGPVVCPLDSDVVLVDLGRLWLAQGGLAEPLVVFSGILRIRQQLPALWLGSGWTGI